MEKREEKKDVHLFDPMDQFNWIVKCIDEQHKDFNLISISMFVGKKNRASIYGNIGNKVYVFVYSYKSGKTFNFIDGEFEKTEHQFKKYFNITDEELDRYGGGSNLMKKLLMKFRT